MKRSIILLFLVFFIAISIVNFQKETGISEEPEEHNFLLHSESSERLLTIMQQISSIAGNENIEGTVEQTEEDMVSLIEAVEELLFYAELMSIKVPANVTEESKSVIFSAMASKLYDEALNIQQLTKDYNLHSLDHSEKHIVDEAFERLNQTCIACHQLFRDQ